MGFSSWLYTDCKKNLRVKIVHPGGHTELHERPVLASEILRRNPKCCVAHPNVFKQPWAIVQPDTMLMPGQKFYIVPISTIRKLQMMSSKNPSSRLDQDVDQSDQGGAERGEDDGLFSPCWSSTPMLQPANCLKPSGEQNGSNSSCFTCMVVKRRSKKDGDKDSSREAKSPGSSGKKSLGKKAKELESPRRSLASLEYWQPDLQCVNEE